MIKNKLILFLIALVLTLTISGCTTNNQAADQRAVVETTPVIHRNITQWVTLTSQLQAYKNAMIIPKQPGLDVTNIHVDIGDEVKEGRLLFELDKTLVREQINQTKLSYDLARENYNKQSKIIQEQEVLLEAYETMSKNSGFFQKKLPESAMSIDEEPRESLALAQSQVDKAQMAYASALRQLSELEYHAPINGVVSQINIHENQPLLNQQPAMVITNSEKIRIPLHVSNTFIDVLELNQEVVVKVNEEEVQGTITLINSVPEYPSNLHLVHIEVDNGDEKLKVGDFCKVKIERDKSENTLTIRKDTILYEGNDTYVFIENNEVVYKQKVRLGISNEDHVEVLDGIEEGQKVVTRGHQYLKDQMSVNVIRGANNEDI
ncbi:efflux RND transporter periplasmic adaptor subunit [Serpentinicella sp. ANB-PHB4]|uniref:efflux RND transporter periplasmic adaptor subunit n=1 Tax=Serpentinicella sp. ANB-PHB4 TaxID=3074076 RepID=UPI002856E0F1|nr:efflux RND transporter periplasmic adaptor subunit [Serpentinicella sp. ANB-PHB4]MDR5658998.1 efflux RND transporter periplasmic adaptor subunit [Serpentinicella sp. ANB-PHB4]